jgi:hypothetical protein
LLSRTVEARAWAIEEKGCPVVAVAGVMAAGTGAAAQVARRTKRKRDPATRDNPPHIQSGGQFATQVAMGVDYGRR